MDCDPRRWDAYERQPDPRHVPGLFPVHEHVQRTTELSYMTNSLQSALASMERVYELLDEPEMEAEPEAPKRIGHALGAVEFSHVRFGQLLVNRHFVSFIHSFL